MFFARGRRGRQRKVAPARVINDLAGSGSETEWIRHAKPLLWLIVFGVTGYAALVNARAAPSLDFLVLGLALDFLGPVGVATYLRARDEGRRGMATFSAIVVALAVTWSLFSALHTGAHGTFGQERATLHAASGQQQLKADIKAAEAELATAGSPRASVAIEAAIEAILKDPRADGCENLWTAWRKTECPKLGALRAELGQAKAKEAIGARLVAMRAKLASERPVAEVEPGTEFAVRFAKVLGYDLQPDTVRLFRAILFMVGLEVLKFGLAGWVAWLTPRSSSPAIEEPLSTPGPEPPAALPPPVRAKGPPELAPVLDPPTWLQGAFAGGGLPPGIERRNGGLQGSYRAFATIWGISPAKAQRLGQIWAASGEFVVVPSSRGTWIGPAQRRLRAIQ